METKGIKREYTLVTLRHELKGMSMLAHAFFHVKIKEGENVMHGDMHTPQSIFHGKDKPGDEYELHVSWPVHNGFNMLVQMREEERNYMPGHTMRCEIIDTLREQLPWRI